MSTLPLWVRSIRRDKFSFTFDNIARVIERCTEPIGFDRACRDNGDSKQLAVSLMEDRSSSVFCMTHTCTFGVSVRCSSSVSLQETRDTMNAQHHLGTHKATLLCLLFDLPGRIGRLAYWAPIPLRLIVGYGFMQHGFAKLLRGGDNFAGILHSIGVPEPFLLGWATIGIEILGGLAILLGAFVVLASIPMAIVLLTAIFTVHLRYGFSSIKLLAVTAAGAQFGPPGYETDLLYLACLAALVLGGPGPCAIDGMIRKVLQGGRRA